MRPRLVKREEAWLEDRARELAEAGGQGESAEERARHEVTHLPYLPWCAWCVVEKGLAKPHWQRPVESVQVPEFDMDFCHLLPDQKRRHQPGHQAWARLL